MRKCIFLSFLFGVAAAAELPTADPVLWYKHPAQRWGDALPIGNGRLGGMVFGNVAKERIQLNEDTICNGKNRGRVNPAALRALPEVRRLLFEGKTRAAEALEERAMMGTPNRQPRYQPLGDLNIEFAGHDNASYVLYDLAGNSGHSRIPNLLPPDQASGYRLPWHLAHETPLHPCLLRSGQESSAGARKLEAPRGLYVVLGEVGIVQD